MRRTIIQILLILLLAISIPAQSAKQEPELLDEFGRLDLDELMGRLDSFALTVFKESNATGFIRIYGGDEKCSFCHYRRGSLITGHYNARKFPSEKYSIEYCTDSKEEFRTQLYLMPMTAALPKCGETLEIPKQSALFDWAYFDTSDSKLIPLEDASIGVGEAVDGQYSKSAWKAIKGVLDKSPESKVYVIVYLGTNPETNFEDENRETIIKLDKKSLAEAMLLNAKKELVKNGIKSSQIETIKGGYMNGKRRLEFRFVPKGGEIPKPKPDYFPKKTVRRKK
jgi:hypothetical protein